MKQRLVVYVAIGVLFGVVDYFYLEWLRLSGMPQQAFGNTPGGQMLRFAVFFLVLNLGLWLVPVIPIAWYEVRCSGSRLRSAVAGLAVWSAGIVAYYLANTVQLAAGVPGREELALSQLNAPHFWDNWASTLGSESMLGGISEYALMAIVGGALVGFLTAAIYLRMNARAEARSSLSVTLDTTLRQPPVR